MAFGPFIVKTILGETIIASPAVANTFLRSLSRVSLCVPLEGCRTHA